MNWRILGLTLVAAIGAALLSGCAKDETGADETPTTKANINNNTEAAKAAGAAPPNENMEFPHPGRMKKGGGGGEGMDPGEMPAPKEDHDPSVPK
jgi:hypothetical protein